MLSLRFLIAAALLSSACSEASKAPIHDVDAKPSGVRAILQFEASAGFFDAPFPIEHRRNDDGTLRLDDFPDPANSASLAQMLALAAETTTGFSLNGAIFIRFDGAIDAANLPSPRDATKSESPLFLVNVTAGSPDRGRRVPIVSSFKVKAESYSPENLLAVMPYPGFPLEPNTTYALVVRRALGGADKKPLSAPEAWSRLASGNAPEGENGPRAKGDFAPLFEWLTEEKIDPDDIAAATVWKTGDPRTSQLRWREYVATLPPPQATELELADDYDDYCVMNGKIDLPIFQKGPKPYDVVGSGYIVEDASGHPVVQEQDHTGFVITVPKKGPMPEGGFPIVLYGNGAGGTARQVIDRTAAAENPAQGLGPKGRGPALSGGSGVMGKIVGWFRSDSWTEADGAAWAAARPQVAECDHFEFATAGH